VISRAQDRAVRALLTELTLFRLRGDACAAAGTARGFVTRCAFGDETPAVLAAVCAAARAWYELTVLPSGPTARELACATLRYAINAAWAWVDSEVIEQPWMEAAS